MATRQAISPRLAIRILWNMGGLCCGMAKGEYAGQSVVIGFYKIRKGKKGEIGVDSAENR